MFTLTNTDFEKIREFLQRNSGVALADNLRFHLRQVIHDRLEFLGLTSADEYIDYLLISSQRVEEQQRLIDKLTITETYFFRNKPHFDVLSKVLLPEIAQNSSTKKLKIWSAGCSSGEEPYSIAITIHELGEMFDGWHVEIIGTDVNTTSLKQAKKAVYTEHAIKMTSPLQLRNYFTVLDGRYLLKNFIKQRVEFRYFNLIKEPYPLKEMHDFDIIFCRNVTIYFKKESTKRVIHNYFDSLKTGGYLFIGHAESLHGVSTDFTLMDREGTFFYCKRPTDVLLETWSRAVNESMHPPPPPKEDREESQQTVEELLSEGKKHLAAQEHEKAIFSFNQVIKEDPDRIEPYIFIGQIYAGRGVYQEALAKYEKVMKLAPLSAEVNFLIGLVYWELEDIAKAAEQFKKAKYLDSGFCLSYYYLGLVYEKLVHPQKAVKEFNAAIKVLEKYPEQIEHPYFAGFNTQDIAHSCQQKIKQLGNAR